MDSDTSRFKVRLAESDHDVAAAQRLRYKVFVEEMGAEVSDKEHELRREIDAFDEHFEHLILIDNNIDKNSLERVVGVYRIMRGSVAKAGPGFYSACEYDLEKIVNLDRETLELGRSCVAKEYRGGMGMHQLWDALGNYVVENNIGVMFGVASFHSAKVEPIQEALSYLHHKYLAPPELRVHAEGPDAITMNYLDLDQINGKSALTKIPSLIKGYLRLGGFVGEGAYIDHVFNTVDVCLIVDTQKMVEKYRNFYAKKRDDL